LTVSAAKATTGLKPPADPYLDPKHDVFNPLRYIANNVLTSVALALFLATTVALFANMWRWGAKFMLPMTIGGLTYCVGLSLRFGLHYHPDSGQGLYIPEYLFVVLSPCAFIAAVYILLGRLARHLEAGHHLWVAPHKITKIFITSDILTFLVQAAGGATSTSINEKARNTGRRIFLVGLILQLISFFFFTSLLLVWAFKVHRFERATWTRDAGKPWYNDWRALLASLAISCFGILVRSFYRCIEISEGFTGFLATTEVFFYTLDALPLLFAIGVYVPFWPGRFIPRETTIPTPAAEAERPASAEVDSEKDLPPSTGTPATAEKAETTPHRETATGTV